MRKSLIFSVQVAHKMFGSLWQVQNCLKVDDLGTNLLAGTIFLGQQTQELDPVISNIHFGTSFPDILI